MSTTTPLMGLTKPTPGPGGDLGPAWANQLNTDLDKIDSHNHASGNGVKITPAGISINTDLSFGSQNAVQIRTTKYDSQTAIFSSIDKNASYVVLGDLWYNNGSGTAVQITSGGSINVSSVGAIGGDYSTSSAALNYNNTTKTYNFLQGTPNTTINAKILCGDVSIYDVTVTGGNAVTIKAPASLGSNYSLTAPSSLPASTSFLTTNPSGLLSANISITAGITQSMLEAKTTGSTVTAGGVGFSDQASLVVTSGSGATIAAVTITTTGRPVRMFLTSTGITAAYTISLQASTVASIGIVRDSTSIFAIQHATGSVAENFCYSYETLDFPAAGTYTYSYVLNSSGGTSTLQQARLVAYEI